MVEQFKQNQLHS